jgi:colanic acid biosynthesis glycosyl transferase WcaI
MKITLWGINYTPELTGIAPFNTALCEYLSRRGHEVDVVTSFPYYPEWKKRPSDHGRIFRTDIEGGIRVHRCWLYVPQKVRALKRMVHEASFIVMSLLRVLSLPRPDVFVVVSPPLLLGVAAWLAGIVKSSPFIFHVQDLQPDAAVGLGMLQKGLLTRFLYWIEAFAYAKAARVSGISSGMLDMFRKKGVAESKIVYFPNGVKLPANLPEPGLFRAKHGIPETAFLVVYSGNMGVKQGLDILVQAAQLLSNGAGGEGPGALNDTHSEDVRPVQFVLAGDGALRGKLAESIARDALKNVLLLPLQSDQSYREMMADADCTVITQQHGVGSYFFPSKLLASLAAAKPVVTVADESSELANAVTAGRFGVNVRPNEPQSLACVIRAMARAAGAEASIAPLHDG